MATCAEDVKNLIVYFVHEDMFREVDWDDVVANPVTELPKALAQAKCRMWGRILKKSCLFST